MKKKRLILQIILLSVAVFSVFFSSYFIIYRPMDQQLKNETYNNHIVVSEQNQIIVTHFIERSVEGAESLSSRSMMADAIQEYKDSTMSFGDLQTFTQPKFESGCSVLTNLVSATRVVDNMAIAEINETLSPSELSLAENISETQYDLIIVTNNQDDTFTFARVISPIVKNDIVVGHDIVTFDMTSTMIEINDTGIICTIITNESRLALLDDANMISENDEYKFFIKGEYIVFLPNVLFGTSNYSLSVEISREILEAEINSLTTRSFLWSGFLIAVGLGIGLWISFKVAANKLDFETKRSEYFQERANRDSLTGLYSRHYLEQARASFLSDMTPLAVVMIDVNKFKNFNDTYGHQEGDKALASIAATMKKLVRNEDLVIRYGGDEFLIFLRFCDQTLCEAIMKRIGEQIIEDFKKKGISLAYGYTFVNNVDSLDFALNEADKLMYENKRKMR